ncbi:MAG: DUF1851 domain-containing protein, partial [Firmicutes bacterium]|nr:DUF1851 domain-containing protein [Bacillota bacterium]
KENVSAEIYNKYKSILPGELLEIWEKYGFGSLLNGYLKIIDPDEYVDIANDFYFREIIPVCVTGLGDIIYIEKDQHIGIIRCRKTKFNIIATSFKWFCECLYDEYYLTKYLEIGEYKEAVRRLGDLEYDECFGYVPLLGAGGEEKIENLKKVKIKEHIELIYQMFGKVK